MRIKAIHLGTIAATLLALAMALPSPSWADPVENRSMTPAARRARQAGDDVFLSPVGIVPPERKTAGVLFHRASDKSPQQLLKEATVVEWTGDWRGAIDVYERLVRSYPYLIEAAEAQLRIGRLQEMRGKYKDAFEEYRYLLYYYPENTPADAILKQMFAIASHYEGKGDSAIAMKYFRMITEIAPKWKYTANALLHLGLMQAAKKEYLDAVGTFDAVMTGYPGTDSAVKASVGLADVLSRLAEKFPEDDASQLKAISSAQTALMLVGEESDERERISARRDELVARRFDRHYQMAAFYDSPRYPIETKIAAYKDFVRRFPQAPQVKMAQDRLAELEKQGKVAGARQ